MMRAKTSSPTGLPGAAAVPLPAFWTEVLMA
jgi:hypothetical protein